MGRTSVPSSPLSPQASPESPLPSSKPPPLMETPKREGQSGGLEGPLVPVLLSKLERLLDQVWRRRGRGREGGRERERERVLE